MEMSLLLIGAMLFGAAAKAEDPAPSAAAPVLKVGDMAPDVALGADAEGKARKLSDFRAKKNVVLAFYPKAFTPGCTQQMCGYRDGFAEFKDTDTEVFAISTDTQEESDRFKEKHSLPFPVLGDSKQEVVKAYGVPTMERGGFAMAKRQAFLIDKEGKIAYIDANYNFADGKTPLMEAIRKLKGGPAPAKDK